MFALEKRFAQEMVAHALEESPNECCGILAGSNGKVMRLYRTTNADKSPYRYTIDPKEMLAIMREADDHGWELVAFYHSHTHSPAYPSATDVRLATWPDSIYLVISVANPAQPVIKAFRIVGGNVQEEPLTMAD